jgi:simple sugar transport system substrate-binding protein
MDRRPVLTAVALAATVVLVSCGKKEDAPAAAAPGAAPAATAQAPAAQGSIDAAK